MRLPVLALVLSALVSAPTAAQGPDRSEPPAIGPAPTLRLPAIQKTTLANGVPLLVIEQHGVPLAQVNVIMRGGSSLDRTGRYGMASLVAAMLDEGAGTRSALELADAVEFLGADLSTSSSFDYSAVRLPTPVKNLQPALALLADVVLRPAFPANELDRLKKEPRRRIDGSATGVQDPRTLHPCEIAGEARRAVRRRHHPAGPDDG